MALREAPVRPERVGGERNVMTNETAKLWKDGAFQVNPWRDWPEDGALEPLEPFADALVPLARFVADPDVFLARKGRLGVRVAPGEDVTALAGYLGHIALIALDFPSFADGRNYSAARLLRERLGYDGEIRAGGDVLSDQIALMRRCGIDAFLVSHGPTQEALRAGRIAEVRHYYQPVSGPEIEIPAGSRPWARQPAA
jgi:phosphoadenosine phosphosulfate reductase